MAKALDCDQQQTKIKRLLRRRNTREYLKEDGWTTNREEAKCFDDVIEVAEVCVKLGLNDVEVTLCLEGLGAELFCTPMRL